MSEGSQEKAKEKDYRRELEFRKKVTDLRVIRECPKHQTRIVQAGKPNSRNCSASGLEPTGIAPPANLQLPNACNQGTDDDKTCGVVLTNSP